MKNRKILPILIINKNQITVDSEVLRYGLKIMTNMLNIPQKEMDVIDGGNFNHMKEQNGNLRIENKIIKFWWAELTAD